jgi:hypothetical protein
MGSSGSFFAVGCPTTAVVATAAALANPFFKNCALSIFFVRSTVTTVNVQRKFIQLLYIQLFFRSVDFGVKSMISCSFGPIDD